MQDTNPLQYLLLESFWNQCNLFCVGDDAQSIYGFRGADFQSIHHFTEVVPDAKVLKLTTNYRSTQEILDLSNWLLDRSPLVYNKHLVASRGAGIKPVLAHFHEEWNQARDIVMRIKNSQGEEGASYADNMVLSRSNWGAALGGGVSGGSTDSICNLRWHKPYGFGTHPRHSSSTTHRCQSARRACMATVSVPFPSYRRDNSRQNH